MKTFVKCINRQRCLKSVWVSIVFVTLTFSLMGQSIPSVHAQPGPGTILVTDCRAGTDKRGVLFQMDPLTGERTLLSDFGDPAQGPTGTMPMGIAIEASGTILVVDKYAGTDSNAAIFRVDPVTGARTLLSNCGDLKQGPIANDVIDIVIEASGNIVILDRLHRRLLRVDPVMGMRTILSDCYNPAQGFNGRVPTGLAIEASGTFLIMFQTGSNWQGSGTLVRVDPVTGMRTLLSEFENPDQGPIGDYPKTLAVEEDGTILLVDIIWVSDDLGTLVRVDPVTGMRTLLSDFGNAYQGPLSGGFLTGIAVEATGAILVADGHAGTNRQSALFRVDPISGARTLLSDFDNSDQGALGKYGATGIAVIPDLLSNPTHSPGDLQWQQTYGGADSDDASVVIQTLDGGYVLAGDIWGDECYGGLFLVKTDSSGTMEWEQAYCPLSGDAHMIIQTDNRGFIIAGMGNGGTIAITKINADGTLVWTKKHGDYSSPWYPQAFSAIQTTDGGFAFGSYTSDELGGTDFWLVKTDEEGEVQWEQTYDYSQDDKAFAIVQTTDDGFALAGGIDKGSDEVWLVKTDRKGTIQWEKTYGGRAADSVYALIQTVDGGFALAGDTNSYGANAPDFWLVKTDVHGNMEWQHNYDYGWNEAAYTLIQTQDEGYALAGVIWDFETDSEDAWLVKTDANGELQWEQAYGGSGNERANSLIQTADGGLALAGFTNSYGMGSFDFWLLKIALTETDPLITIVDEAEIALTETDPLTTIVDEAEVEFSESEVDDSDIDLQDTNNPQETATITVTKETLVTVTPDTETPVAFVPGFEMVELGLALGCLLIGVRIRRK